jgi:hypothetical protein
LRYTKIKAELEWQLGGSGGQLRQVGVDRRVQGPLGWRGRRARRDRAGGNWDLRYALDGGAGSSKLTWQALGGIGYRFSWGEAVVSYRHLAYEMKSDRPVSRHDLQRPAVHAGLDFPLAVSLS